MVDLSAQAGDPVIGTWKLNVAKSVAGYASLWMAIAADMGAWPSSFRHVRRRSEQDPHPAGEGLRWIAHGFGALGLSDHEILQREFIVYDALYAECQRRLESR